MFHSLYVEAFADTQKDSRKIEREAFERSLMLLKSAQSRGPASREAIEAIHYVNRLWTRLMEDLASEGNGLPDELRASLISVGIWVLRRTDDIRLGKVSDFSALIDVTRSISKGLEAELPC